MKQIPFQKLAPYIAGIALFFLVTIVYFNPLLSGKRINQGDIVHFKGASKEIVDYREKTGEEALWTNSMFGGMPAYQISLKHTNNLLIYVDKVLQFGLPRPAGIVLLYFLGFFMLLLVLRVNPWLSIIGALAFGFSSYFFIILGAGHNTKAHAIAYMAPVLSGIILAYRGKYLWGGILTALFLGLEIRANHPQITYYLLLIVLILGIFELVNAVKTKLYKPFAMATLVLLLAALFAVMANITTLWTTYEYSKATIRGKSELTTDQEDRTSGLDKSYATHWSYGISESFSLMIPNVKGGATGYLSMNKKAMRNVDPRMEQYVQQYNHYWGDQPGTAGPVYVGAIIIFFFVLGLFIVKGRLKWILLTATILSILLSWGKNFMPLTSFFLDYFPLYNKFRAVSMMLVIAEFCIPVLAILAVNEIVKQPEVLKKKFTYVLYSLGFTAGLSALFYLLPTTFFSFFSEAESVQFKDLLSGANAASYQLLYDNLESARISIFRPDVFRSMAFIVLAFGLVYLLYKKTIKTKLFLAGLGLLVIIDMIPVCYRYLNKDSFVSKSRMERPFPETKANAEILKDKDPDFRVYNLATDTFNESGTSYFHKTIGGYHGAKLRRYQELIEHHIFKEYELLAGTLAKAQSMEDVDEIFEKLPILNMLNTKYFIFHPSQPPLKNKSALGNAWFVNKVKWVPNADQEIKVLGEINTASEAVVDDRFKSVVASFEYDSTASIRLTEYKPNYLSYQSNSKNNQLAVFSEIYYAKGWNAYIDGKKVPYVRANYVLRALSVPAGEHKIEFKFEPKSYFVGKNISLIASLIVFFAFLALLGFEIKKYAGQN